MSKEVSKEVFTFSIRMYKSDVDKLDYLCDLYKLKRPSVLSDLVRSAYDEAVGNDRIAELMKGVADLQKGFEDLSKIFEK